MASSRPSVFLLGVGYIGNNVLDSLLVAKYSVTALVRQAEQASVLKKAGAKTVLGTLADLQLITAQTSQHEITINTANCDDLPSVEAILAGVKQRIAAGKPSTYLHTSGTGELEDGALGMYKNDKIYRDDVREDIDAIPPTSMHRHVDNTIVKAAGEFGDKAKIVIILPPIIYGYIPAHNRLSFATKSLVRFNIKHGFAGYVGEGRNVWNVVHVKDLGRAYMILLEYMEKSTPETFLENPYFFVENGAEITMKEGAENIAQILHGLGKIQDLKVQPFSDSDYADVFGPMTPTALGSNARSRAVRLRKLGWEPKETDIWTSWKADEVPAILAALESE
ncbi:NAD(P)-binding protein [Pyrenochaeta sp. DS3sAY3a]|nr:NAD(P)-binding protein [Pyrenochaeta sp. DS3sAY3a]